jgi:hypothetical protein
MKLIDVIAVRDQGTEAAGTVPGSMMPFSVQSVSFLIHFNFILSQKR